MSLLRNLADDMRRYRAKNPLPAVVTASVTPRRILSRADAATYCGLSVSGFDGWVRRGLLPTAVPGTRRWDRHALDEALDRARGGAATEPSPLDKWLADRAG